MSDVYSADTNALDAFAERSGRDIAAFASTVDGLSAARSRLAALPLPAFVSSPTMDRYRALVAFAGENGRFVADVSDALKDHGDHTTGGIYQADAALVDAALARSDDDRLDALEADLVARGVDPEVAAAVRAEVAAQLAADPTLGFGRATVAGLAAHQGVTVEEAERAARAFELFPTEAVSIVEEHFDEIAGRHGDDDQITLDDLRDAIDDDTLPPEVRDAAYRLAADQVLFTNLDVARQTDLSDEPLGNGFDWSRSDGIIGRDDVAQFPDKDFQARVLLAWHPLVETAGQGYDLSRADSQTSAEDVAAFVEDEDIPAYVRLAVFDVYAERHGLELSQRQVLEQELAFDGRSYGGGRTVFEVGQPGQARTVPVTPVRPTTAGPRGGPGGRGGGAAAAVSAQVLLASTGYGWNRGRQARIEQDGSPAFVATDPLTGHEVSVDPAELADLTPAQAKAYIAHLAATVAPPSIITDEIEPHSYLDPFGQWRMSDTNEPVWIEPPPGQFYDGQGQLRYRDTQELVDPDDSVDSEPGDAGGGGDDDGGDPGGDTANADDGDDDDESEPRQSNPQDRNRRADPPSWVRDGGHHPTTGDRSPSEAATRIMNDRYGVGGWTGRGAGSAGDDIPNRALTGLRALAPSMLVRLVEALQTGRDEERRLAARLLVESPLDAGAMLTLVRAGLGSEEDPGVLAALTVALGHTRSDQAIADLQVLSNHPDGAVRFAVPGSLAMCASDRFDLVADTMLALSADPDDDVRWSAAFELGAWLEVANDPRIGIRLGELADDSSTEVREVVRRAFEDATGRSEEGGSR